MANYGLLSNVMALKDDSAFLDMIDPRVNPVSRKYFGILLTLESDNQIHGRDTISSATEGLDAVMGRLEDLRCDDDHGSGVKDRAQELWDFLFDIIKGVKQQTVLKGELKPLTFPPGMTTDPVPDLLARVKADSKRYAETTYRLEKHIRLKGISNPEQVVADIKLIADLQEALTDSTQPLHSLARHHEDDLYVIKSKIEQHEKGIIKEHQQGQLEGREAGASKKLNNVRTDFVQRLGMEKALPVPNRDNLWEKVGDPTEERGLLSDKEASTLREASRIKANLQHRIEAEKAEQQSGGKSHSTPESSR